MNEKHGLPTGKHTLVEEGTEFKGTLSSNCPIVVMGKVEGEVAGPAIHVTQSGVVAGNVKVKELHSAGELAGEVEADAVRISGRVRDKTVIRARSLEVTLEAEKGGMQVVFGECELAVGEAPSKEAAITAALAPPADEAPKGGDAPKADAAKPEPAKAARRKGASEAMWDEAAANKPDADDDPTKRKRGTLPPPMT